MTRQHLVWISVLAVGAVFLALTSPSLYGQEVLVIEGGTVIDGTGSAPQADTRIVVRNGRIQAIGPASQVNRPASAQVIDATGKFIIPGLIDSHVHYFGYEGELYLFRTSLLPLTRPLKGRSRRGTRISRSFCAGSWKRGGCCWLAPTLKAWFPPASAFIKSSNWWSSIKSRSTRVTAMFQTRSNSW